MAEYRISKRIAWSGSITERVAAVMRLFGLAADRLTERCMIHECMLEIKDGDIVYISGPSGSGKSVLLDELEKAVHPSQVTNLGRIELPQDKALIDCIDADVMSALRILSVAGLNDCFCILNQPAHLSDGEKYRFLLANALAAGRKFIFADEFCSNLDRITAAVISHNMRKFATRTGTIFILAASRDDILQDLAPDVLVVKEFSGAAEVIYKCPRSGV